MNREGVKSPECLSLSLPESGAESQTSVLALSSLNRSASNDYEDCSAVSSAFIAGVT